MLFLSAISLFTSGQNLIFPSPHFLIASIKHHLWYRLWRNPAQALTHRRFWYNRRASDIDSKTACPEFESLCPCQSALPTSKPECSFAFGFCLFHTGVDLVVSLATKALKPPGFRAFFCDAVHGSFCRICV